MRAPDPVPTAPGLPDRTWRALLRPGAATDYFPGGKRPAFDGGTAGFQAATAWWLSEFSRLIYRMGDGETGGPCDGLTREAVLRTVGWTEAWSVSGENIRCALFRPRGAAAGPSVLVFRGTMGLRNWLLDLDARPVDWPAGGRVHRGFADGLSQVRLPLERRLSGEAGPVLYTGHSLGGALALLAASAGRPGAVYAFGSPRTGDATFAAGLDPSRVFNVVNGRDLVPSLPPPIASAAFLPAGLRLHLEAGELREGAPRPARVAGIPSAARRLMEAAASCRRSPPDALSDHAPVNYRIGIEALLERRRPGFFRHGRAEDPQPPTRPASRAPVRR